MGVSVGVVMLPVCEAAPLTLLKSICDCTVHLSRAELVVPV